MPRGYRPQLIQSAFVHFIGSRLTPFWSLNVPKLRLLARVMLSEELVALQFETNRAFKQQVFDVQGWNGGQHIDISVPIDGIYHQRSYSLVGLPQQPLWWNNEVNEHHLKKQQRQTITIAIKPQGVVSHYLAEQAPIGTIFDSGIPSGDFTLAQASLLALSTKQPPLLFIASGSGITPMLGLIKQALQAERAVTLLHYNRMPILMTYWDDLAKKYPAFNYYLINTDDPNTYLANTRHLSTQSLLALDLPLADTQIFACGSQTFLTELYRVAAEIVQPSCSLLDDSLLNGSLSTDSHSLRDNIVIERFGSALPEMNKEGKDKLEDTDPQTIYLRSRQRQFMTSSTLLLGAEQASLRLPYGCRQGICQMCRCNKVSGIVKNSQTGRISGDGYESIQTCINVPMTDVVLDI
ncbi:iron-sulfur cluster-binding domain-containing protein [Psychrobacter frigidicola]|uniref:Iron-sulfur cluster-binding domain-containing protein n=1 Tax=Psychrobacter frigidicola TaxID=45611 RepID=A0A5C7A2P4_9GAMM|nr:iron-sulfur cluster-binding domain-containing protein [Psychrobacter frigidicola]TXD96902.1 iron-sulfur cluster-binding domain-containing protein [Psychrobacter frigidicola]